MKLILAIMVVWVGFGMTTDPNRIFLPDAVGFFEVLFHEIASGRLLENILATFARVFFGLAIGLFIGLPLGIVLGVSNAARREIMPLIEFFRGIPTSMLFPVFIVLFGIGELSKTAIIASTTFPIILINTVVGCMPRPEIQDRRDYLAVHARHLPVSVKMLVTVWDALPPIIGGLKVAISISLVLTIVTEMFFVASSGVGWAAHQAYLGFDLELMYCYVIVVGIIGLALNQLFDLGYRKVSEALGDFNGKKGWRGPRNEDA
uniref:NitT/TauT family transport system permease protein n=1 Tax=Candidatus Kentrum sp. TC TaxID=2126339 RepID=A0A450YEG0_9GAMM|nr:MAG: NitT/TauT family transport system permease protein [Candidatus Kentron sp. TC]VFK42816.1 MAG: NitT/TauT family transport system permease protein [Candidatus Kentron sp. TC]VFK57212.1 MAG: NitT/TauT family transport system permease protein [Candidatus Kentron sp. TC]